MSFRVPALLSFVGLTALLVAPALSQVAPPDKNTQARKVQADGAQGRASKPANGRQPKSVDGNGAKTNPASRTQARRRSGVTPEQEAAVKTLVRQHHPDLESLLDNLKKARPAQYVQAIRELFRTSVKLAAIQERDMERYDLELKLWKMESQSQLLALKVSRAKKAMEKERLTLELGDTTQRLQQARTALLQLDLDRQRQRLARLEERLQESQKDAEQIVKLEIAELLRSARALAAAEAKARAKAGPVAKPKPGKLEVDVERKNKSRPRRPDAT